MSTQSDETPDIGHHLISKVRDQFSLEEKQKKLRNLDVPDYLLCRITDELMEEPVVLDSGFTYERAQIQRHFRANGCFDPLTRQEVDPNILIENRAVKQATQDYLVRNPWAFEFIPG
jgi:STIP1 family protein 1